MHGGENILVVIFSIFEYFLYEGFFPSSQSWGSIKPLNLHLQLLCLKKNNISILVSFVMQSNQLQLFVTFPSNSLRYYFPRTRIKRTLKL